ncbi:MAG: helix-turn-helix domain-containing protein [Lachnospiraceae bacterium]|jgi:transcriptional regulator with XRE-family HTH domain|nr:helix-turn-helix domain-containing protein [Lachnospiraceae bacterium]
MGFESIGIKIREKRDAMSLRQEDLAEKANLSVDFISKIERGERFPKLQNFVMLLNELDASADEILADVLDKGYITRSSYYVEQIATLPKEEQERIFAVLEALLKDRR